MSWICKDLTFDSDVGSNLRSRPRTLRPLQVNKLGLIISFQPYLIRLVKLQWWTFNLPSLSVKAMADVGSELIGLAFSCALGVTFLVLACALPQFNNWWPMFVLFFYILSPIPTVIAKRASNSFDSSSSACIELCIFLTTGIVVSALGLPLVLAHTSVIQWGACGLVLAGNVVVFLTILGYFKVFGGDDLDYSMW